MLLASSKQVPTASETAEAMLAKFSQWLDKMETILRLLTNAALNPKEQLEVDQKIQRNIQKGASDLDNLHKLFEAEGMRDRLEDVDSRWRAIQNASIDVQRFNTSLKTLDAHITQVGAWVDSLDIDSSDIINMHLELRQGQKKLGSIRQQETQVEHLQQQVEALGDAAQQDFTRLMGHWEEVVQKINKALKMLSEKLRENPPEPKDIIDYLLTFLDKAEEVLKTDELDRLDLVNVTQTKIERLRVVLEGCALLKRFDI